MRQERLSLEAEKVSPKLKRSDVLHMHGQQARLSELDQWIADLSDPSFADCWIQTEDLHHTEKTSKSLTKLGEVYIRTISTTYGSADEMVHTSLPPSFKLP